MKEAITINAFFEDDTKKMLDMMQEKGLDIEKCFICGDPIFPTERPPRYLRERWDAWRHKKKFYDWDIGAISSWGVCCDRGLCFVKLLDKQREERLRTSFQKVNEEVR